MDSFVRGSSDTAERVQARIVMFVGVGSDGVRYYRFNLNGESGDGAESMGLSLGLLAVNLRCLARNCPDGWVDTFAILRWPDDRILGARRTKDVFVDALSEEEFARLEQFLRDFRRDQVRPKKKKRKKRKG
ncbi:hypothetical protein IT398_00055 [Candidatus Nomurabacteria bacterium]|nr:hypothetical protein [Candidatus Nomurabacteria bacterium]